MIPARKIFERWISDRENTKFDDNNCFNGFLSSSDCRQQLADKAAHNIKTGWARAKDFILKWLGGPAERRGQVGIYNIERLIFSF